MPFTLQDPTSGLFWVSGLFGRVQLGIIPNSYVLEGKFIKNRETGSYVNHRAELLHEGGEPDEFEFHEDGTITSQGKAVIASTFVRLGDSCGTPWVKVDEAEDDVPVNRASALIEEALNATKKCGCECGCEAGCEGCACEGCECPKAPEPEAE
jgi:hypothetical protein